jgi:hypothetical protein
MGRMEMSHSALAIYYKAVQAAPQIPLLGAIWGKTWGKVKEIVFLGAGGLFPELLSPETVRFPDGTEALGQ